MASATAATTACVATGASGATTCSPAPPLVFSRVSRPSESSNPRTRSAASRTGTVLATMTLPSDWWAAASSGAKALSGTWQDTSADATGTAGHFEIMDSGGTTCHMQGSVTATGGGGDMTLDNTSITAGQQVTVTTFTVTAGGA